MHMCTSRLVNTTSITIYTQLAAARIRAVAVLTTGATAPDPCNSAFSESEMRNAKIHSNRNRGFTLVELMLVMLILAILAAVVVPRIAGHSEDAKKAAAKTDIANIDTSLDQFEVDCGRYPSGDE